MKKQTYEDYNAPATRARPPTGIRDDSSVLKTELRAGRHLCVRIGEERVFIKVMHTRAGRVTLGIDAPDEVSIEHKPVEGEEHLWPDGGRNCASLSHAYKLKKREGII